ncbi:hypothetical protein, partial [Pyramidobacter piscolens]|uniref:hypothetical protein n=1 Tax=Pyramidobacter piscolens TaxID=638849 RepID=UPI0028ED2DF7
NAAISSPSVSTLEKQEFPFPFGVLSVHNADTVVVTVGDGGPQPLFVAASYVRYERFPLFESSRRLT